MNNIKVLELIGLAIGAAVVIGATIVANIKQRQLMHQLNEGGVAYEDIEKLSKKVAIITTGISVVGVAVIAGIGRIILKAFNNLENIFDRYRTIVYDANGEEDELLIYNEAYGIHPMDDGEEYKRKGGE